jgi:hypothetical protein
MHGELIKEIYMKDDAPIDIIKFYNIEFITRLNKSITLRHNLIQNG